MKSRVVTGGFAMLLGAGSMAVPASATPNAVTVTSGYETNVQSSQQSVGFDSATGTFRAEAAAEAFGPAGSAGLGATRGSAVAVWSGGTRATGRITSRVESRDGDNYADVPFNYRQVGTTIESEFLAQFVVADTTPGDGPVPVTFDLRFTGRMSASGDRGDPNPWPALVKAEGSGWVRADRGGLTVVDPFQGDALLDAYNGVADGGDFDGALDEAAEMDDPGGGFLLHSGRTYAGSVRPGDTIVVFLSSRLSTIVNDASNGHVLGDLANEPGFGASFELSSTDPNVSFITVPEPTALALLPLSTPLLRRRRTRN
jgi:hypothetical protein